MIFRWMWARIKRIRWWGWLLIAVTFPCWLALLFVAAPYILAACVVLLCFLPLLRRFRRPRRIRVTGRAAVRTRPGRNPYRP